MKVEKLPAYIDKRGNLVGLVSTVIPRRDRMRRDVAVMLWDEWETFKKSFLVLLELHKEECDEKNCIVIVHAESLLKEQP